MARQAKPSALLCSVNYGYSIKIDLPWFKEEFEQFRKKRPQLAHQMMDRTGIPRKDEATEGHEPLAMMSDDRSDEDERQGRGQRTEDEAKKPRNKAPFPTSPVDSCKSSGASPGDVESAE